MRQQRRAKDNQVALERAAEAEVVASPKSSEPVMTQSPAAPRTDDHVAALTERAIAGFLDAWRTHDLCLFSSLFAADGRFRNTPFAIEKVGPAAIDAYMDRVRTQTAFEGGYKVLGAADRTGSVRWHVSYRLLPRSEWPDDLADGPDWPPPESTALDPAQRVELAGLAIIRFDADSRIAQFEEAWHMQSVPSVAEVSAASLFQPLRLGAIPIANRIVMAPLTRARSGRERRPGALAVTYYRQRASAGLIVTEGTHVSEMAVGYADTPGIWRQDQIEAWAEVVRAVHDEGGRIVSQLWHVGRRSHSSLLPDGVSPVAPSAIAAKDQAYTYEGFQPMPIPRALEIEEIAGVVEEFASAAANARAAGFDGIELHAANAYLIDQFLRDGSNQRTDRYGGSIENRMRLLLEIVDAVANRIGPDRVGVRLSPFANRGGIFDRDPDKLFATVARALGERGLAYLHVGENVSDPHPEQMACEPRELFANMRKGFGGPYLANGGYDRETALAALTSGTADAVAFGQLFLANPDLVSRLRKDAALNPPLPQELWYGGGARGYVDQPRFLEAEA